ncbi:hypothetical protein AURDEDRAFT_160126 [Auricularia subglabra TFB-10046 SS5]|nr:hypothetical protein AURDEDRAFT_160126 [Auricularia subglabra TFB-10046 SS5]
MRFSLTASIFFGSAFVVAQVLAAAVYPSSVLYPRSSTVWKVYGKHNVTWDIPTNAANPGRVQLRKMTGQIRTLATNVDLRLGRQAITVPSDLEAGTDYFIVVKGTNDTVTVAVGDEFIIYGASGEFWGYPPVTYPRASTVWKTGSAHNVTWNTDFAPKIIANKGAVFLRKSLLENYLRISQNDFDLSTGRQVVYIPVNLKPGQYRVTLEGYENNYTEEFTIASRR